MSWNYIPEIIAIIVLAILLAFHQKTLYVRTRRDRLFTQCIVIAIVSTFINICSVLSIVNAYRLPIWLPYLVNDLYFSVALVIAVAFLRYWLFIVYEDDQKNAFYSFCIFFGWAIAVIMVLATVANRFYPILYSFNAAREYVREKYNTLPFYLVLINVIFAGIGLSRQWRTLPKSTRGALFTAVFVFIPFIILGNIFRGIQMQGTTLMIVVLVLYLSFHSNAASYDMLTDCFNLDAFYLAMRRSYPSMPPRAFVQFSLLNYATIRTEFGHTISDSLIRAVAIYLKSVYGAQNTYRIAEDSFVCAMMEHMGYRSMEEAYAQLNADWLVESVLCRVECCVAYYETHNAHLSDTDVLAYLNYATTRAREAGTCSIVHFSQEMLSAFEREREIVGRLKESISSGNFQLYFDPICRIDGERSVIIGADCGIGLRFEGESDEISFSDEQILRVAEQYNLLNPINELILRRACAFQRQLSTGGFGDILLICEITQTQLLSGSIIARVCNILEEEHADSSAIKLQIGGPMLNSGLRARECLAELTRRGIGICMKDTGRVDLDDLLITPLSYIKINEAELFGLGLSARLTYFFKLALTFFSQFNTTVIARNVISSEHIQYLVSHGFPYAQGAGVMPAMDEEEFMRRLKWQRQGIVNR